MPIVLIMHIAACTVGYLAFGCAFVVACMYLVRDHSLKTKRFKLGDRFPLSLNQLDRYLFLSLLFGFSMMSVGIPLGVIVQKAMYGKVDYTSIRTIFPAVIWLFYFIVLLVRQFTGLRGKVPAYLSAYGFSCAAFSFIYELSISST